MSSGPIGIESAHSVRKAVRRSRARGGKAVRRSGRGKSVCYNTRVPLRRGLCAIPFRFTLSSEAHRREVQEERMERGEVEMVVLLFLLSGHGSCIGSEWVKLDVASELSLFSRP